MWFGRAISQSEGEDDSLSVCRQGQSGKSGGSCSDGSLLSMYSSGTCTDDDIFGPLSKHPSRASLGRDPGQYLPSLLSNTRPGRH